MTTFAWNGGECPVDPETVVYPVYRDGSTSKARVAGDLRWQHEGLCDDIVAYGFEPDRVKRDRSPPRRTTEQFHADQEAGVNPIGDPTDGRVTS